MLWHKRWRPWRVWMTLVTIACLARPTLVGGADQQAPRLITVALSSQPFREWTDNTGLYRTAGTLIGIGPRHVRIFKANGRNSTVPMRRLSPADLSYVDQHKVQHLPARTNLVVPNEETQAQGRPRSVSHVRLDPEIRFDPSWSLGDSAPGYTDADVVRLRISGDLIALVADRSYTRSNYVNDVILGRCVRGTAQTTAATAVQLVSSSSGAVLDYVIRGSTISATTTDAGIVQVHGSASTHFEKLIRVSINEQGIGIQPAPLQSSTNSAIQYISTRSRMFRRLIGRVASRRANEQKPQVDAIARQRAHGKIESSIETEWRDVVANANQFVAATIERLRGAPRPIQLRPRFQSSADGLHIVLTAQLPADSAPIRSPPPSVAGQPFLVAQIHASFVTSVLRDEEIAEFVAPFVEQLRSEPEVGGQFAEIRRRLQQVPPIIEGFPQDSDAEWATIVWDPTKPRERLVSKARARQARNAKLGFASRLKTD